MPAPQRRAARRQAAHRCENAREGYADDIASLQAKLAPVYERLNARLETMRGVFERASGHLQAAVRHAR